MGQDLLFSLPGGKTDPEMLRCFVPHRTTSTEESKLETREYSHLTPTTCTVPGWGSAWVPPTQAWPEILLCTCWVGPAGAQFLPGPSTPYPRGRWRGQVKVGERRHWFWWQESPTWSPFLLWTEPASLQDMHKGGHCPVSPNLLLHNLWLGVCQRGTKCGVPCPSICFYFWIFYREGTGQTLGVCWGRCNIPCFRSSWGSVRRCNLPRAIVLLRLEKEI
jgi:hypothetical protein